MGKKQVQAKKPLKPSKAKRAIEGAENKLAKKLPASARKQFANVQKREANLEDSE